MHPSQPRTVVHSGVAPTIRARSALVRAMSALNKWEAHYLAGRGAERVAAYQELMRALHQAEADMAEATGQIGYEATQGSPIQGGYAVAQGPTEDLADGDHYAGMPRRYHGAFIDDLGRPMTARPDGPDDDR